MTIWRNYLRWNDAIAQELFSEKVAGQPVYLDMEEEVLEKIAEAVDPSIQDAKATFIEVVRGTLNLLPGQGDPFEAHMEWIRRWKPDRSTPPPPLSLLALLSLAAQQMRASDGMAAHNYYGRLANLLALGEAELPRLQSSYRDCAEDLWRCLNEWLEICEGDRGLPTAFALTHRYVGLPISQALVRRDDRRRFRAMFASYGLPSGYQLSPPDMQRLLEPWILQNPAPVSGALRTLWERDPAVRDRIASVASIELEAWDGTTERGKRTAMRSDVRLIALLRTFMGQRLELGLVVRGSAAAAPQTLHLLDPKDGSSQSLEFSPAPDGSLRLVEPELIDEASLLSAPVLLQDPITSDVAKRQPKRLVPLRKDELMQAFVEGERVQLGENTMVLCQSDLDASVEAAFERVARPGWRRMSSDVRGLPDGWSLFTDVQIFSVLDQSVGPPELKRTELNVLVPLATSQLILSEGLQLPGRMRKWTSLRPPEIRALSERAETVSVALEQVRSLDKQELMEPKTWRSASAALIIKLDILDLSDGDYRLLLREDRRQSPATQALLRLRSADAIARDLWGQRPRLVHHLGRADSLSGVSAEALDDEPAYVEGARVVGQPLAVEVARAGLPNKLHVLEERAKTPRDALEVARVSVGAPEPTSCLVTGAHRIELPDMRSARPTPGTIEGSCASCGMVKRYPATHWQAKKKMTRSAKPAEMRARIDVSLLDPVHVPDELPWDVAFDAVCHVGGGPIGHLERIALQLEGSSVFAFNFMRTLEYLGHIDVERDPATLAPTRWELAPSVLAELPDGRFVLAGYRSRTQIAELGRLVAGNGGRLDRQLQANGPEVVTIRGLAGDRLTTVIADLAMDPQLPPAAVMPEAANALARSLPPLSVITKALPQAPLPYSRTAESWDAKTARWVPSDDVAVPGVYRLRGFTTVYGFRTEEDVDEGTIRLATVHLLKHIAAASARQPLIAYHEETGSLIAPLGCDLPGLYGRTPVMCSGELPVVHEKHRMLQYRAVLKSVAHALLDKLMS